MKRTALTTTLILALIISAIAGPQITQSVKANPFPPPPINSAYIRSDGSVEPTTLPIIRAGNLYKLSGNISNYTIQVQSANIVIDGVGFSLQGAGNGGGGHAGITLSNCNNVTLKNIDIEAFSTGILIDGGSNNAVLQNRIDSYSYCISLPSSSNQIAGNNLSSGFNGIHAFGSYNSIIGNDFTSGLSGPGAGIELTGNSNTISSNILWQASKISTLSNDLFNEVVGIELLPSSQYNTIYNNTILNGGAGILIVKSGYNVVAANLVNGTTDPDAGALYLSTECFNNIVYGNQFENNVLGVSLGAQVSFPYLTGTSIWNNVYNNSFYWNDFINGSKTVFIADGTPANFWDNGSMGNYWSDYTTKYPDAVEVDKTGTWNKPYLLNGNIQDNYPLISPFNNSATPPDVVPEFSSWIILPLLTTLALLVTLVYFKKRKREGELVKNP